MGRLRLESRVARGSPGRLDVFRAHPPPETPAFRLPARTRAPRKDLWQSAPADITREQPLLVIRRSAVLLIKPLDQFDRGEVVAALLLERAAPDTILIPNSVTTRI